MHDNPWSAIWGRLAAWHTQHGTPDDERVREVLLAAHVLELMAVDGMSQRAAREDLGLTKTEMARHVAVLVEAFPPFEGFLVAHAARLRAGDRPAAALPVWDVSRTSRRRLKAPADGRWNDGEDSRLENDEAA